MLLYSNLVPNFHAISNQPDEILGPCIYTPSTYGHSPHCCKALHYKVLSCIPELKDRNPECSLKCLIYIGQSWQIQLAYKLWVTEQKDTICLQWIIQDFLWQLFLSWHIILQNVNSTWMYCTSTCTLFFELDFFCSYLRKRRMMSVYALLNTFETNRYQDQAHLFLQHTYFYFLSHNIPMLECAARYCLWKITLLLLRVVSKYIHQT